MRRSKEGPGDPPLPRPCVHLTWRSSATAVREFPLPRQCWSPAQPRPSSICRASVSIEDLPFRGTISSWTWAQSQPHLLCGGIPYTVQYLCEQPKGPYVPQCEGPAAWFIPRRVRTLRPLGIAGVRFFPVPWLLGHIEPVRLPSGSRSFGPAAQRLQQVHEGGACGLVALL